MYPADDPFYARLATLSDAELFHYIQNYSQYKVAAVQAAIAELERRDVYVSNAQLSEIDRYFTRQERERMRPFSLEPRHLRLLSYGIFTLGIGIAIAIYVTSSSILQYPLGYDPFTSKKYLRELEIYGGKINILAVQLSQWFDNLWRGKNLAYTIAVLTIMLSSILWFLGSHTDSDLDTHSDKPHAPLDTWS